MSFVYFSNPISKDKNKIISARCPPNQCCTQQSSCDYYKNYEGESATNSSNVSTLCAYGRDVNSPLCSKCYSGLSEVFGSTTCQSCDYSGLVLMTVPFSIGILVVITCIKRPNFKRYHIWI